jgi:hypothetical protein
MFRPPLVLSAAIALCLGCFTTPEKPPEPPAPAPVEPQKGVDIRLERDTTAERATKVQLEQLLAVHPDLEKWIFTRSIRIDERATPHSHPVLTLHTRHLRDDLLLLSTFVHEQAHWYAMRNPGGLQAAIAELRGLYPSIAVGAPDGDNDVAGSHLHLLINTLEYRAMRELTSELSAHQVMSFWAQDHYKKLYRTVLDEGHRIIPVMRKHNLWP